LSGVEVSNGGFQCQCTMARKSSRPMSNLAQKQCVPCRAGRVFCFPISSRDSTSAWGRVDVQIYTHKIRELAKNDFVLAAKIDQVYVARLR
jgi:hypothetical protein